MLGNSEILRRLARCITSQVIRLIGGPFQSPMPSSSRSSLVLETSVRFAQTRLTEWLKELERDQNVISGIVLQTHLKIIIRWHILIHSVFQICCVRLTLSSMIWKYFLRELLRTLLEQPNGFQLGFLLSAISSCKLKLISSVRYTSFVLTRWHSCSRHDNHGNSLQISKHTPILAQYINKQFTYWSSLRFCSNLHTR